MSTSVKYFHSGMFGAPVLTGTAGTFLAVLDACLVNGFGGMNASSLTVSGEVATLVTPTGHPFDEQTVVVIGGATPAGLNGEKRVLSRGANQITFAAPGVADGAATGTITVALAAAGWEKQFSASNLAAYRSTDLSSTRAVLRVDDTGTQNALVRAYESMSDINTGIGPCPTVAQAASGYFWPKANAAGGSARSWVVIADAKTVWIKVCTVSGAIQAAGITFGAGDFASRKAGDPYAFSIFGPAADTSAQSSVSSVNHYSIGHGDYLGQAAYGAAIRSATGVGGAVPCFKRAESYWYVASDAPGVGTYDSGVANIYPYPNTADNALLLSPLLAVDATGARGRLRGPLHVPQNLPVASFPALTLVDGQGALAGRKLMALNGNTPAANSSSSVYFFDVTGPWE